MTAPELLEETSEELYEEAPCGYLATAPDGTILRANRTFLRWSGYTADELVGTRRFYDLLPAGAKIYYETHYAPLLQMQGAVREIALEIVRADGSRLPVLVNATLKEDEAGRPLFARITVFDASDRRRYEQELLQARVQADERAAAASALAHVAEGVVLVDDDGRVRVINPAAERILGVAAAEVRGLTLESAARGWAAVATRIPSGGAQVVVPLTVDGDTRWLAASAEAAAEGLVYTLRDVTEERRLEAFRDDIVAVVSHELRTPLAGVYGAVQTLTSLGDRLQDEQKQSLLEVISRQTDRLVEIVEKVLLTQRLDTGGVRVDRVTFDVGQVVTRLVDDARGRGNAVALAVEPDVTAEGDEAMFEQVFVNLLDNAVKYGAPDAETRVSVGRSRADVRVTVADSGAGVPAGERERIFEKFYRLDPDQMSGVSGTGLGLYIARELVRRMHGRIGLLPSERGAAFYVDLPHGQA